MIFAGDNCLVVGGIGLDKSPNIGKKVKVISAQGEHSKYGRIWRCEGPGILQLNSAGAYIEAGWGDFAASWLLKIDPNPVPTAMKEKLENEINV